MRILPTTLRELRPTLAELEAVSREARPLVRDLRPAARALEPDAARRAAARARAARAVPRRRPCDRRLGDALPATTETVEGGAPGVQAARRRSCGRRCRSSTSSGLYKREIVATFANIAAATQGAEPPRAGGEPLHYLRALVPFTAEGLAADKRFGTNRHNPYFLPGGLEKLATGARGVRLPEHGEHVAARAGGPAVRRSRRT